MGKYIIRLDDACPKINAVNWDRIENLLDKYNIRPLVGIIPDCQDPDMDAYEEDQSFWTDRVQRWKQKNWTFAMHGYQHVFHTNCGGINPVNKYSEFAGLPFEQQQNMIAKGIQILKEHKIYPPVFFAPAHTFDENTLKALLEMTAIRFICDTPSWGAYQDGEFTFIPQQSGKARILPFAVTTFCYHPNTMRDLDFLELEYFFSNKMISDFPCFHCQRTKTIIDYLVMKAYFFKHR